MNRRFISAILLLPFLLILSVFAQTTSRLTGTVHDRSGAVIGGARVVLLNEATGVSFETVTTSAGAYLFDAVKPGSYTVRVAAPGFKSVESKGNVVTIGQPTAVNLSLSVGAASETVEVKEEADLV